MQQLTLHVLVAPIEIVSKVILRHADLSTTQRYLGKVDDTEAIRWIETLYGQLSLHGRGIVPRPILTGIRLYSCFSDNV